MVFGYLLTCCESRTRSRGLDLNVNNRTILGGRRISPGLQDVCPYVYTYVYTQTRTHIHRDTGIARLSGDTYTHTHTHTHTHTYAYTYTYSYTYTNTYLYIHTHPHTFWGRIENFEIVTNPPSDILIISLSFIFVYIFTCDNSLKSNFILF